jgi:hypothetical protein
MCLSFSHLTTILLLTSSGDRQSAYVDLAATSVTSLHRENLLLIHCLRGVIQVRVADVWRHDFTCRSYRQLKRL